MAGSDIFSFLPCKGAVVDDKLHGDGWLGNLLERNCLGIFRTADGVSDGNVGNSGDCNDRADARLFDFCFVQPVKFVELADAYLFLAGGVMLIYHDCVHADFDCAVIYFSDSDAADIFVVVDGADKNLGVSVRVALRSRDIIKDGLKQRFHVTLLVCQVKNCNP